MAENDAPKANGPKDLPFDGRCPNCRKDGWTISARGVVAGLNVQPFICDTCGFVALMHAEGQ